MTKSYAVVLQGLYASILTDVKRTFPSLGRECERDLARILLLLSSRGTSYLTMELPAVGKIFDKSLSCGYLLPIHRAGFSPYSNRSKIPVLYRGLWSKVFDDDGCLRIEPEVTAIRFLRQLFYAAKKVRINCNESRRKSAIRDVFRFEQSIRSPSLPWDGNSLVGHDLGLLHFRDVEPKVSRGQPELFDFESPVALPADLWEHVQYSCDVLSGQLGFFEPDTASYRHGNGAVADSRGPTDKYRFPSWSARLESVFPLAKFGYPNYGAWADMVSRGEVPSDFDGPCRLLTVPKDQKKPRVIACEPTSHQWCQQAIWRFLEERIPHTFLSGSIRFRDQTQNQTMALDASRTQSHSTIDLSSASDSVSLWTVERTFRRNLSLLDALRSSRSAWLFYESPTGGKSYMALKKFAAMGAATTFPIQSLIYGALIVGVLSYISGRKPSSKLLRECGSRVSVFGDDLIVPIAAHEKVVQVLTALGFFVNHSKTFSIGNFRESCGIEAFNGSLVTPAYWLEAPDETRPSSVISCVATRNNFYSKGLFATAEFIESLLPGWIRKNLPLVGTDDGDFGLVTHYGRSTSHLRSRWNANLHIVEKFAVAPRSKSTRTQVEGYSSLHQYFTEAPSPLTKWSSGVVKRPQTNLSLRWVPG
jgi:hypothetical protein